LITSGNHTDIEIGKDLQREAITTDADEAGRSSGLTLGANPHAVIDRSGVLQDLPVFMLAEEGVVAAAARNIDEPMKARLKHALAFQVRCAMIGDMEGVLAADEHIEHMICEAANQPSAAAELKSMKSAFKLAWRAANKLRDVRPDVECRERMVGFIVASDEAGAVAEVRRFYARISARI
jgi:DNA-binding GntR family transcriptional regulator